MGTRNIETSNEEAVEIYFNKMAEGIGWLEMNYLYALFGIGILRSIVREEISKENC